jgi:hypothetical protein
MPVRLHQMPPPDNGICFQLIEMKKDAESSGKIEVIPIDLPKSNATSAWPVKIESSYKASDRFCDYPHYPNEPARPGLFSGCAKSCAVTIEAPEDKRDQHEPFKLSRMPPPDGSICSWDIK